jgi:hypothetical protein
VRKPSIRRYLLGLKDWVRYKDFGLQLVVFPRWFKMQWEGKLGDLFGELVSTILSKLLGYGWNECRTVRFPEYLHVLPDGAKQATDVYLPRQVCVSYRKVPTVLIRLPYWKDDMAIVGRIYASHGYACVLQDIRGTAHSIPYGAQGMNLTDRDEKH